MLIIKYSSNIYIKSEFCICTQEHENLDCMKNICFTSKCFCKRRVNFIICVKMKLFLRQCQWKAQASLEAHLREISLTQNPSWWGEQHCDWQKPEGALGNSDVQRDFGWFGSLDLTWFWYMNYEKSSSWRWKQKFQWIDSTLYFIEMGHPNI